MAIVQGKRLMVCFRPGLVSKWICGADHQRELRRTTYAYVKRSAFSPAASSAMVIPSRNKQEFHPLGWAVTRGVNLRGRGYR